MRLIIIASYDRITAFNRNECTQQPLTQGRRPRRRAPQQQHQLHLFLFSTSISTEIGPSQLGATCPPQIPTVLLLLLFLSGPGTGPQSHLYGGRRGPCYPGEKEPSKEEEDVCEASCDQEEETRGGTHSLALMISRCPGLGSSAFGGRRF